MIDGKVGFLEYLQDTEKGIQFIAIPGQISAEAFLDSCFDLLSAPTNTLLRKSSESFQILLESF